MSRSSLVFKALPAARTRRAAQHNKRQHDDYLTYPCFRKEGGERGKIYRALVDGATQCLSDRALYQSVVERRPKTTAVLLGGPSSVLRNKSRLLLISPPLHLALGNLGTDVERHTHAEARKASFHRGLQRGGVGGFR